MATGFQQRWKGKILAKELYLANWGVVLPLLSGKNLNGSALVAATPGANDFVTNVTLGSVLALDGHAAQLSTKTDHLLFDFALPPWYIAGSSFTISVNAQYRVSAGTTPTCTIDASAYLVAADGTTGADIVSTSAQNLTTSAATYAFAVTPTTLVPGDCLAIELTTSIAEAGNTGTFTGQINSVSVGP